MAGGGRTRIGAVVRADCVEGLTEPGWSALTAYGIRTVIDLRNHDELGTDIAPRPDDLDTVHLPLDDIDDTEFWGDRWYDDPEYATPLYYRAHLERFPARSARVITAIARARPGGVLFHCVRGRDRTGQISMLVLALAGVAPEAWPPTTASATTACRTATPTSSSAARAPPPLRSSSPPSPRSTCLPSCAGAAWPTTIW